MEAAELTGETGREAQAGPSTRRAVEAAIAGDAAAFERLMADRLQRTYRLAQGILGSAADASDAVQDAWLMAWRGLPGIRDVDRFDAWLDRIVVNACRMSARRGGRVREIRMVEGFDRAATSAGPEDLAERDALERAFDGLSVDHRTVLVLHHVEQRPLAAIADALGIPVGTAKSRLHAARAALQRALENDR
jgi:RNA polymerase sigma-70 factor, ECF subfamily